MRRVEIAVLDLDNTLYDWYSFFLPAFYAMVDEAARLLVCDREILLDELQTVHKRHSDVEHPFSLFETTTVQSLVSKLGSDAAWKLIDPAFHAFNRERKLRMKLFPDTLPTLLALKSSGIRLIAFTDSTYFAAIRRIHELGLSELFEHIFCRRRAEDFRSNPQHGSKFDQLARITTELPAHETKPDPRVLVEIASLENVALSSCAYIGDSLTRDILMAKRAGCFAIWAKYGTYRDKTMYEKLVRVSHWSAKDIEIEKRFALEASNISPDFTCEHSIVEVLTAIAGPSSDLSSRRFA